MQPELVKDDHVILDPELAPIPGGYTLAHLADQKSCILRKYREVSDDNDPTLIGQLLPINADWRPINLHKNARIALIATVIQFRRDL